MKTGGPEFNIAPAAITFQLDGALRTKVERALRKLREDGTYQQVYNKWFGSL